jgi:hypothetical protein
MSFRSNRLSILVASTAIVAFGTYSAFSNKSQQPPLGDAISDSTPCAKYQSLLSEQPSQAKDATVLLKGEVVKMVTVEEMHHLSPPPDTANKYGNYAVIKVDQIIRGANVPNELIVDTSKHRCIRVQNGDVGYLAGSTIYELTYSDGHPAFFLKAKIVDSRT